MQHDVIREISDFIFMEDAPTVSDLILLPGSSHWEHVEKAAELYHQGFAPCIMPCGMYSYRHDHFLNDSLEGTKYAGCYKTEAAYYRHILMVNGVPESAIILEDRSTNTFENAMFAALLIKEQGLRVHRALLCCQAFHARRAYMTFARYLKNVDLRVIPAVTQGIDREHWYMEEEHFLQVMSELEKCGKFFQDMFDCI